MAAHAQTVLDDQAMCVTITKRSHSLVLFSFLLLLLLLVWFWFSIFLVVLCLKNSVRPCNTSAISPFAVNFTLYFLYFCPAEPFLRSPQGLI